MPTIKLLEELHSGESAGAAYIWELGEHLIFGVSEGPLLGHGGRGPNVNTGVKEARKRGYPNPVAGNSRSHAWWVKTTPTHDANWNIPHQSDMTLY